MKPLYKTKKGELYLGDAEKILPLKSFQQNKGKINLIFTSPPFPLIKKKAYGNLTGDDYIKWLSSYAVLFRDFLAPDGSIVIEIGNAWEKRSPTMSLFPLKSLISFKESGQYYLCQEFIWYNPTKLPTPAQWVNIERIRVKDAFTRLWWLSSNPKPKANNKNILNEYSKSMKELLEKQRYNSGKRPSEHIIGKKSFLKNNDGSIPSNVIIKSNTISNDSYLKYCRENDVPYHPARMPIDIVKFFIMFLTNPNDLILDPFAGSNTTGYVAEIMNRKWISIEKELIYANSSRIRFGKTPKKSI